MNEARLIIKNSPLFFGVSEATVSALCADATTRRPELSRGDALCRRGSRNEELIVILSGRAEIRKGGVTMRTLEEGEVTGVSTLFGENAVMESDITAQTKMKAICFGREAVLSAIASDKVFAEKYIGLLSSKIRFLNGVIDRCTGSDAATKLARYLCERAAESGVVFTFNSSLAASKLDIGRATLYRALSELTEKGLIEKRNKTLEIKDIDGLKKYSKE